MWDGINRRKFPRVHYKCVIHIRTKDSAKSISTITENIGVGGICVIVNEDLGLFQGVSLEIDLENGMPANIKCSGTVVWVVRKHDPSHRGAVLYDTGIEFVDIDRESADRINQIVEVEIENAGTS
ncbi:MAG: PilZ domain-containing protein [Candidatus Omnitrophica bacterium]|nr:PilZ domain-containing protein [Candidatus Omnitrophota bacterium]